MSRVMTAILLLLIVAGVFDLGAAAATAPEQKCAAVLGDLGAPTGPKALIPFCPPSASYFTLQDTKALIPRVVVERLDGEQIAKGCVVRGNNFHADPKLPTAKPSDYLHSGYDLGHQRPAEDADYSAAAMSDTFNTANMAPQLPGFNRQIWKGLETWVRAAALSTGDVLVVYTGPILGDTKSIGADDVVVPTAFYKVIYDEKAGKAWAFIYGNVPGPENAPVAKYQDTIGQVEKQTGISFPFRADRNGTPALPQADETAWRQIHAKACAK